MKREMNEFYRECERNAVVWAEEATEVLAGMQGNETVAVQKDEIDLSTSADIAAERVIIDHIQKTYPTHAINSEERGLIPGSEPFRWVIDPLDETKEYRKGISEFNCLIALEHDNRVVMGVTVQHGTQSVYTASRGNGAACNGKPVRVSAQTGLMDAFIGLTVPNRKLAQEQIEQDLNVLKTLLPQVYRVRPFWDQSKAMAWVSRGALEGHIAPPHVFKWYDIASTIILVEEAGGIVTDWFGNPVTEETSKNGIVAGNPDIHPHLLGILANYVR